MLYFGYFGLAGITLVFASSFWFDLPGYTLAFYLLYHNLLIIIIAFALNSA